MKWPLIFNSNIHKSDQQATGNECLKFQKYKPPKNINNLKSTCLNIIKNKVEQINICIQIYESFQEQFA